MRDFHFHGQRWRKAFRWAPGCTPLPRAPGPTRRAQAVGRSTNSCPPEPKTPSSTSSTASAAQNLNLDASKLAVRFSPHNLLVLPSWGWGGAKLRDRQGFPSSPHSPSAETAPHKKWALPQWMLKMPSGQPQNVAEDKCVWIKVTSGWVSSAFPKEAQEPWTAGFFLETIKGNGEKIHTLWRRDLTSHPLKKRSYESVGWRVAGDSKDPQRRKTKFMCELLIKFRIQNNQEVNTLLR